MKRFLLGTIVAGTVLAGSAQATTFTFSDEYYVANITTFHTLFGATTTGYGTSGVYQLTDSIAPNAVTKLSNGSSVPGEYIQNTTPNANEELITNGFSASLNNGQQVGNVFNLALGGFIRFAVGGSTTPFTFNSFDLSGSGTIQIRGELNLNPVAGDLATINLTSTPTTYTFDWTGIDTVDFISGFTRLCGRNP
jgi:hypothetical protein